MSEEAALEQMVQDWCTAANEPGEAGATGYASFLTEDVAFLPPNGERLNGREAARAFILDNFISSDEFSITWEASHIEVSASGDLAYGFGPYEFSMKDADGNAVEDRGKWLDVFRKQADGSWKASALSFNSDQAAD